jgi:hypothetical protein
MSDQLIGESRHRGVIFTMLMAGCITIAVTTMFGADKNAVIATIIGYSSLLVGMISLVAYAFQYGMVTMNKNITFVVICAIIMVLIFINLYLFSKYINEISLGYVPYLTTFTFLIAILLSYSVFSARNFVLLVPMIVDPVDSMKLYIVNTFCAVLLICKYIALKYFITDG